MKRRLLPLVVKEALILATVLIPLAAADYYSPYSYNSGFGYGGGGAEPIVSLTFDPQGNLNNGFRLAAREDRLDELQSYLKAGAEVNSVSDAKHSALMIAARNCSPKLVRFLLDAKADVNLQDKLGRTALMFAAGGDCLPVVNQLSAVAGVKIRIFDREGHTAFDYAGSAFQITDRLHAAAALHRVRKTQVR